MGLRGYLRIKIASDLEYGLADDILEVSTHSDVQTWQDTFIHIICSTSQVTVQMKLDMLLKEFRDGKREGSIFSTQTVDSLSTDERQAWHTIRKELQDVGISVAAFDSNKDFIMSWFKTAISTGAFEEKQENDEFTGVRFEDEVGQSLEDSKYENSQNRSSEEGEQENEENVGH